MQIPFHTNKYMNSHALKFNYLIIIVDVNFSDTFLMQKQPTKVILSDFFTLAPTTPTRETPEPFPRTGTSQFCQASAERYPEKHDGSHRRLISGKFLHLVG